MAEEQQTGNDGLRFVDEIPGRPEASAWETKARNLMQRPGQWAEVVGSRRGSTNTQLRRVQEAQNLPGQFEVVQRTEGGTTRTYARFVASQPEAT